MLRVQIRQHSDLRGRASGTDSRLTGQQLVSKKLKHQGVEVEMNVSAGVTIRIGL